MNTPWKTVQKFDYNSVSECISKLKEDGYKVSEWITDVGNRLEVKSHNYPVDLFRVKVSDLGFDSACKLKDIYQELFAKGFNTVSPDIAILTRFLYDEQPNGEWLRIATPFDSMTDSDGIPHLPKLGRGLGMYFIETYFPSA